jgi:small GTP-binding protein
VQLDCYRSMSKQEEEGGYHISFKVSICGDTGVGKTTLLDGEGASTYARASGDTTVGINFRVKFYEVEGKTYRVQFWDCPGAERYMKLTSRYCAGSAGAILVFDINNRATFEHLEEWIRQVEKNGPILKVLVGNKVDDNSRAGREITTQEAEAFADKHGMDYFETAALTGLRVNAVFQDIFTQVVESMPKPPEPSLLLKKGIKLGKKMLTNRKFRQSLFLASQKAAGKGKIGTTEFM